MVYTQVGRVPGSMGMASMMMNEYDPNQKRSTGELLTLWMEHLDKKHRRGWKWALKNAFDLKESVDKAGFVRATAGLFNQEEGMRLWDLWAADGLHVERAAIEEDLASCLTRDTALFANANRGGSLDAKILPGSKSRSNVESADSSLAKGAVVADEPYVPASISQRPITPKAPSMVASKMGPPPSNRTAGVAQVTGGTINNGSSVEGGIFSHQFLMGPPPPGNGTSNKSNQPSIAGGIFEDHSEDPVVAKGGASRSQKSSVTGGIFAAAPRPSTIEYGYERFPRQGLNVTGK